LEAEAAMNKQNAREAHEKSAKAYELAKDTILLQKNISDELKTNIASEISQAGDKLTGISLQTENALEKANEIYDEALSLFANVNSLSVPTVDIEKIKRRSKKLNDEGQKILNELDEIKNANQKMVTEFDDNTELANR
jgi:laminin, gamma 1